MPPVSEFLTTFRFDPVAAAAIAVGAVLYGLGLVRAAHLGIHWPKWRAVIFYACGLGAYAWIQFGFLGTWSHDLRWAFTTRICLLLFLVPPLIAVGTPITLARATLGERGRARLERIMRAWPVRMLGNAMVAPLVPLAGFLLFLTPLAGPLRLDAGWAAAITLIVPFGGLVMTLPIAEDTDSRSSNFIIYEFLLCIVEFMLDSIPGIFLRVQNIVLDHVPALTATVTGAALPAWFPNTLHDQHLSGDFLWFLAEIADLPVIIALLGRWGKVDRKDAKQVDSLSDEDYEAQMREHLRGRAR